MDALLWLTPAVALFLYWFDTAAAKELATAHGKRACKDIGVQFLDDSVIRHKTRIQRNHTGSLCFTRDFRFEFTLDGRSRHTGYIRLLGKHLQMLDLDLPASEDQGHDRHLILTSSYSKDSDNNALCTRAQERADR